MRSTFKLLYYINRAKVKADGTTAVLCRITIDGKNSVITTGIYCKPEEFNTKKGEVKDNKDNDTLLKFRRKIESAYEAILKDNSRRKLRSDHFITGRHGRIGTIGKTLG